MLMSQVHLLEHMTQVTLQIGLFLQTQMVQEKQKVSFLASLYAMLPAMEFLTHQSGLCMFLVLWSVSLFLYRTLLGNYKLTIKNCRTSAGVQVHGSPIRSPARLPVFHARSVT